MPHPSCMEFWRFVQEKRDYTDYCRLDAPHSEVGNNVSNIFHHSWAILTGVLQFGEREREREREQRNHNSVFHLVARHRHGERLNLQNLPSEVLHRIVNFLPPCSAAAMTLCSRHLYSRMGSRHLEALRSGNEPHSRALQRLDKGYRDQRWIRPREGDLARFLTLLQRDLPNYIFCHRCVLLHDEATSLSRYRYPFPQPAGTVASTLCAKLDHHEFVQSFLGNVIYFSALQFLMKRYRLGLDCTMQLEKLSGSIQNNLFPWGRLGEPQPGRGSKFSAYGTGSTHFSTVHVRIAHGKVLVRKQQLNLISAGCGSQIVSAIRLKGLDLMICEHMHTSDSLDAHSHGIEDMSIRILEQNIADTTSTSDSVRQCRYCYTEFQLEARPLGQGRLGMFVTTWCDLGECLTPLDPRWCTRVRDLTQPPDPPRASLPIASFTAGSIKHLFENEADPDYNWSGMEDGTKNRWRLHWDVNMWGIDSAWTTAKQEVEIAVSTLLNYSRLGQPRTLDSCEV